MFSELISIVPINDKGVKISAVGYDGEEIVIGIFNSQKEALAAVTSDVQKFLQRHWPAHYELWRGQEKLADFYDLAAAYRAANTGNVNSTPEELMQHGVFRVEESK